MSSPASGSGLFPPDRPAEREPRSPLPWIIALAVVILVIGVLLGFSHRARPASSSTPTLAALDPSAASLPITSLQMSQASSVAGAQSTYVDGQITNNGQKTVNGITVQVVFHGFTNSIAQQDTTALRLIRTREPYVDTQPVSAAPIHPGETRDFRLIFDTVSGDWNQNYPEIRITGVTTQ
jgi:hypothetical protein